MPEMLFVVFDYYVIDIVYCGYCCGCDVFVVVRMFSPDPPLISSLVTGLKRRLKCQVLAE
jgi:hypothetical protein